MGFNSIYGLCVISQLRMHYSPLFAFCNRRNHSLMLEIDIFFVYVYTEHIMYISKNFRSAIFKYKNATYVI